MQQRRESGQPVMLLLAGADLGSDGRAVRVIFVRLEHPLTCGSAGCATTAYRIALGN